MHVYRNIVQPGEVQQIKSRFDRLFADQGGMALLQAHNEEPGLISLIWISDREIDLRHYLNFQQITIQEIPADAALLAGDQLIFGHHLGRQGPSRQPG